MSASKLSGLALQRWKAGPEDESVVDAMCDFAQKQMDEMALRVFEDTRERIAAWLQGSGQPGYAAEVRAMQPDRK
jgi:hypothetical protein